MRILEGVLVLGAALAIHLLFLSMVKIDGQHSSGVGGNASVTLTGSTASMAAMVQEWTRPPDTQTQMDAPDAPPPELEVTPLPQDEAANVRPVTQEMPSPADQSSTPIVPSAPGLLPVPAPPMPEMALLNEPEAPPEFTPPRRETTPDLRRPPAQRAPQPAEVEPQPQVAPPPPSPLAPRRAESPPQRPERQPQQQTERAEQNSAASAAQPTVRARGSGGGSNAGQSGTAETSTLSAGEKASLMATWSAQIQRATQRRLVYPRKARRRGLTGRATVLIKLTTSGALVSVAVRQGTGEALLDDAAIQTMQRVGTFPSAPKGLPTAQYPFLIPVVFR